MGEPAKPAKGKRRALVSGTRHELQRHQDSMPEREQLRDKFEEHLREVIEERKVSLIVEEAGDDTEVWHHLKEEDEAVGEFAILFGGEGSITGDSPVPTIAKEIADEEPSKLRHVDIRAKNADELTIGQRDEAMATRTVEVSEDADSILVIVGEAHRNGIAERLASQGFDVESESFPEE